MTKKPIERWLKNEYFPIDRSLLTRGFYLTNSPVLHDKRLNFTNCKPKDILQYVNPNVNENSPIELRRSELSRWSLFKAGINLFNMPYTTCPLRIERNGGRSYTGKQWIKHIGGGAPRMFFWIDQWRIHPEDKDTVLEEVIELFNDADRSAKFALIAGGLRKRYITATSEMKPGDIIRSSRVAPHVSYKFNSGDCFPLVAFPTGSKLCHFEKTPGSGSQMAISAGCSGTLTRKFFDEKTKKHKATIEMPSRDAFILDQDCLAVYGVSSNIEHNKTKYSNFPQKMRATDKRSRSGLWTLKGGRFGRKIYAKRTFDGFKDRKEFYYQPLDIFNPFGAK